MGIKPKANWEPCNEAAAVTKSDTDDLPGIPQQGASLYVGVTGDVKVDMALGGTGIVFKAWPAGSVLPILIKKVHSTGTSATDMVAIW